MLRIGEKLLQIVVVDYQGHMQWGGTAKVFILYIPGGILGKRVSSMLLICEFGKREKQCIINVQAPWEKYRCTVLTSPQQE